MNVGILRNLLQFVRGYLRRSWDLFFCFFLFASMEGGRYGLNEGSGGRVPHAMECDEEKMGLK